MILAITTIYRGIRLLQAGVEELIALSISQARDMFIRFMTTSLNWDRYSLWGLHEQ
jgi:hypothetical protein